jgi:Ca-activated chloride channel family protein
MLGKKMDEARRALRHFVNGLRPGDRFNIVDFATEARKFREGLVEMNDESRRQALAYVDAIPTRGGTNIEEALAMALAALEGAGDDGRLKMVVLVTDGEPTVGITRPDDILRSVREKNARQRRIFSFGIGAELNAQLLDRLAVENRAAADYVLATENIEVKLSAFWDKIDFPVLTDLRLEFPNLRVSDVYPKPLPDLFRGETLIIAGRYAEDGRHPVVLRGRFQGEEKVFEYSLDFQPASAGGTRNDFVARLWATRKIGYLLDEIRLNGQKPELVEEVKNLAQRFGIVTPYTSYFVTDDRSLAWREGRNRTAGGRVEMFGHEPRAAAPAAGSRYGRGAAGGEAGGGATGRAVDEAASAPAGKAAVDRSVALEVLRRANSTEALRELEDAGDAKPVLKQVGSKTFYLRDGVWQDSTFTEGAAVTKIVYLSPEYFALLGEKPELGKFFALGKEVIVCFDGVAYRVTEKA